MIGLGFSGSSHGGQRDNSAALLRYDGPKEADVQQQRMESIRVEQRTG
jgi:hypothetical protein